MENVFMYLGVLVCMLLPAVVTFFVGIYVGYWGRVEEEKEKSS